MPVDNAIIAADWPGTETYDTLIYADAITLTLSNAAASFSTSWDISGNGNNNMQGLPVGIYTVDGGTTWYDANGNDGPIRLNIGSNSNGTLQFSWTGSGSGPANYIVVIKAGLLSISQTETLNVPITGSSAVLSFNTGVNYQKILTTTEVSTGTGSSSVGHNLGKNPVYRVWRRDTSGRINNFGSEAFILDAGVYSDTSNITLLSWISSLKTASVYPGQSWIVRVYKDE